MLRCMHHCPSRLILSRLLTTSNNHHLCRYTSIASSTPSASQAANDVTATDKSSTGQRSVPTQQSRPDIPDDIPEDMDLPTLAAKLKHMANAPSLTFLLGGPGSGKGTLSSLITERTDQVHVSVGNVLREAAGRGTAQSRQISAVISRGGIVSSALSTRLLLRYLITNKSLASRVVVDGYPRTFANAVMFDSLGLPLERVVALEVDERVMKERLSGRGRRDDIPYIVQNRLIEFRAEWESIKEFYRRRNLLVELDASGAPEDVWKRYLQMEQVDSGRAM